MKRTAVFVTIILIVLGILLGGMSADVHAQENPEILIIEAAEPIIYAAWNHDETLIRTGSRDSNAIRIWDVETGELVLEIPEDDSVIARIMDSDFTQTLSWTSEVVAVRNIWTDETLLDLRHDGEYGFRRAASNSDGSRIRTLQENHEIAIWDGQTGEQLFTLYDEKYSEQENGLSIQWSPDESQILVMPGFGGGTWVDMWDADSGNFLYSLQHDVILSGAKWNTAGSLLLTTALGDMVWVWDTQTGTLIHELPQRNTIFLYPSKVMWNADESLILVVGESNDGCIDDFCGLRIWDAGTGDELLEIGKPPIEPIDSRIAEASWSPVGNKILVRTWNSWLYVWDLSSGEPEFYQNLSFPTGGIRIHEARWDSDGSHVLIRSRDYGGIVVIREVSSGTGYRYDTYHEESVVGIQGARWNRDGTRVLIWGDNVIVVEVPQ